jgi:hypothetical protein
LRKPKSLEDAMVEGLTVYAVFGGIERPSVPESKGCNQILSRDIKMAALAQESPHNGDSFKRNSRTQSPASLSSTVGQLPARQPPNPTVLRTRVLDLHRSSRLSPKYATIRQ